ncbi:hypothetical protein [Enterococcus olivae]
MTDLLKILRNFYSKHEDNIDLLLDLLDTFVTIVEIFSPEWRFTKKLQYAKLTLEFIHQTIKGMIHLSSK